MPAITLTQSSPACPSPVPLALELPDFAAHPSAPPPAVAPTSPPLSRADFASFVDGVDAPCAATLLRPPAPSSRLDGGAPLRLLLPPPPAPTAPPLQATLRGLRRAALGASPEALCALLRACAREPSARACHVALLLRLGAEDGPGGAERNTALHVAAMLGRADLARALLRSRKHAGRARNAVGRTPLMLAAVRRRLACVRVLLGAGGLGIRCGLGLNVSDLVDVAESRDILRHGIFEPVKNLLYRAGARASPAVRWVTSTRE